MNTVLYCWSAVNVVERVGTLNTYQGGCRQGQRSVFVAQEQQQRLLSGDATWHALKQAVNELSGTAPKDHDVVLRVADLSVHEARYIEPHSFLFQGISDDGRES